MTNVIPILLVAAFLWGSSTPLFAYCDKHASLSSRFNYKLVIPFVINQLGSIIYVYALGKAELSLVVPLTNSLTFVFTEIVGRFFGEKKSNKYQLIGMAFIMTGTYICALDKMNG